MNPQGVILDIDGTLVDSNDAHALAWVRAFEEAGHTASFAKVRRLIGMGGDKLMPEAIGLEEGSDRGKQIARRRKEIFQAEYLPGLKPLPGARDLLFRMHDDGLRLSVATSASRGDAQALLKVLGAGDLIDEKTSKDDAESSKPDPDIVVAAMRKLGLPPESLIMLGDTPYDIEAASRAGIRTVAFRSGGWKDEDLQGAIEIYDGPEDLLLRYESSPFAPKRAA
ncbi:MAG TPA: HAD family hydrolase [Bdellovibrionota bacterium]|nr:HAD family hydrolase [Bdellovibrionota bacterium]